MECCGATSHASQFVRVSCIHQLVVPLCMFVCLPMPAIWWCAPVWRHILPMGGRQGLVYCRLCSRMLPPSRKDKARKLKQLQAELLTLEDDISAVTGRKALANQPEDAAALSAAAADGAEPGNDGYPAVLAGLPAPRLPSELLQMRLNGAVEVNGDHQPGSPQSGMSPDFRTDCFPAG